MGPLGARMVREGWDAIAEWRDHRMGEAGDLWHRAIIDPGLLGQIGAVRGLRILDLGCGNGYLTRRWARAGARSVVGVDRSARSLAIARRRELARPSGARFLQRDAADLRGLPDHSIDLVACNMALMDIPDLKGTVREVARVLADGGRFVFSICHPCFDLDERSAWEIERQLYTETVWRKVRGYTEERMSRVPWKISDTKLAYTRTYHRTLETYVRALGDAGLAIRAMREPRPGPEAVRRSPQGRFMLEVPLHLVVEAAPWPSGPAHRPRIPSGRGSRKSVRTSATVGRRRGWGGRRRGTGSARRAASPGS